MKFLFDNFERLADAPNGVQKLREMILQLAVQGKLVEQDPKDEPASVLLEKIKKEKERLVEEGKIKKQKVLPPIADDEKPFNLPKGWEWCRIRSISRDWGQKKPDSDFTYIDVTSINKEKGIIGENIQILNKNTAPSRARKIVKEGTVIYSTVRPYLLNISIIGMKYSPEPIASTAFAIVHTLCGIQNFYLYYYFRSKPFIYYVESKMIGMAYPAINDANFFSGLFPLPPLNEQKRIVAQVDQLMSLCDELEKQKEKRNNKRISLNNASLEKLLSSTKLSEFNVNWNHIVKNFKLLYSTPENVVKLKQAILQLAVQGKLVEQNPKDEPASVLLEKIKKEKERLVKEGKIKKQKELPDTKKDELPFKLPKGWEQSNLAEIGLINPRNYINDGEDASFVPMPYIFAEYGKSINTETRKWGEIKKGFTHFAENDVALAKITPCFENKKSAVMKGLKNGIGAGTTELYIFRTLLNMVVPEYVLIFLKSPNFVVTGKTKMTGSAGQKRVPKEYFSYSLFPLPPLNEQKRLVSKVDQLMSLCDTIEKSLLSQREKSEKLVNAVASKENFNEKRK